MPNFLTSIFGEYLIGWENDVDMDEVYLVLYDGKSLTPVDEIRTEIALEQIFLTPSDHGDVLVLTTHSVPDEEHMTHLEINKVKVESGKLVFTRQLLQEVSVTACVVSYSIFDQDVFCLASQNDINRRELAIFAPQADEFKYIDFEQAIQKSHLTSELLVDDGFTCWSPIQMDSADVPIFVVAFGCKMRFRSFYS